MIDEDGYRPNVGIVICNAERKVLWARRVGRTGWQFPQGGIREHETPEQAMYRELYEEVGLTQDRVELLGFTSDWLRYDVPRRVTRASPTNVRFRGQKQRWFLLRLTGNDSDVNLFCGDRPEFDHWCWVDYWHPVKQVVHFKRDVYRQAMSELEPLLFSGE